MNDQPKKGDALSAEPAETAPPAPAADCTAACPEELCLGVCAVSYARHHHGHKCALCGNEWAGDFEADDDHYPGSAAPAYPDAD